MACDIAVQKLNKALDSTKKELEAANTFNQKKMEAIDKVQKAQTKRWLKNEYGVALRAGVEDEVERLCSTQEMVRATELTKACHALVEEHEETLPRAVLDGLTLRRRRGRS